MAQTLLIRPRLHKKVHKKPSATQRSSRFWSFSETLGPRGYVQYDSPCPSPLNINFAKPKRSIVLVQLIIRFYCVCVCVFISLACSMLLIVYMSRCSCCWYRHGVMHPFGFSIALAPKVCLLCPCYCSACLVNPHISLYHVAFIAFLPFFCFPCISH